MHVCFGLREEKKKKIILTSLEVSDPQTISEYHSDVLVSQRLEHNFKSQQSFCCLLRHSKLTIAHSNNKVFYIMDPNTEKELVNYYHLPFNLFLNTYLCGSFTHNLLVCHQFFADLIDKPS